MSRATRSIGGDRLFALVLLIITVAYLAIDYRYKPALRAVPAAVAWVMLFLLVIDLVSHIETSFGRTLRARLNPPSERAAYPALRQLEAISG